MYRIVHIQDFLSNTYLLVVTISVIVNNIVNF